MNEDFGDFEGDPTSINQIPSRDGQPARASVNNMHATPPGPPFAAGSPSLSYGNQPPQMLSNQHGGMTQMGPGGRPSMGPVSPGRTPSS